MKLYPEWLIVAIHLLDIAKIGPGLILQVSMSQLLQAEIILLPLQVEINIDAGCRGEVFI